MSRRPGSLPHAGCARLAIRAATAGLAVATVVTLAACTFFITPPKIELQAQGAYNTKDVLIPYSVESDQPEMTIVWDLERYDPAGGEWLPDRVRSIVIPGTAAGLMRLELWNYPDGRYRISAQLQTDRAPDENAPSLRASQEFYLDTQAPWGPIDLNPGPPGPGSVGDPLSVTATYTDFVDPDRESPVRLYHVVNSTVFPTSDQEPTVDSIVIAEAGEPPYTRVLTIVAIDDAGNVGRYRVETYSAP